MSTRDIDRGWNRIKREYRELERSGIKVGLRAGPSNDGVPVVEYAAINEFGTDDIPSRPFMRRTADKAHPELRNFTLGLVRRMVSGAGTSRTVLDSLGTWFRERIQATVRSSPSWAVPNSRKTIALKKSSVPLVDEGILINSVDYEITRR